VKEKQKYKENYKGFETADNALKCQAGHENYSNHEDGKQEPCINIHPQYKNTQDDN
jgi:hypothetical protein